MSLIQGRRRISNHAWISFFRTEKHYHIDATTSTLQRMAKTSRHLWFCVQVVARNSLSKGRKSIPLDQHARFVTSSRKERCTPRMDQHSCSRTTHVFTGRMTYTWKGPYLNDRRTYVGPAPSNIHDEDKAVRSASPEWLWRAHRPRTKRHDDHRATTRSRDKDGAGTGFAFVRRRFLTVNNASTSSALR